VQGFEFSPFTRFHHFDLITLIQGSIVVFSFIYSIA
jgi:hypothetical protein